MVLPALPKDPVALLDWQEIDLDRTDGDLAGYLSRTVVPSLFSAPVFVRLVNASGAARHPDLLATLEKQCGAVPVAVQIDGANTGFANPAMFRLSGEPAGQCLSAPLVADVAALLSRLRVQDRALGVIDRTGAGAHRRGGAPRRLHDRG
ncbi:MAG: hypothetical protein R3E51_21390 [Rhizobiaceae bacterium]